MINVKKSEFAVFLRKTQKRRLEKRRVSL